MVLSIQKEPMDLTVSTSKCVNSLEQKYPRDCVTVYEMQKWTSVEVAQNGCVKLLWLPS